MRFEGITTGSDAFIAAHEAVVCAHAVAEELRELRRRLAGVDERRQQLEADLAAQAEDADDAQLNRVVAQLGALERERSQCLAAIEARSGADSQYAIALDHKRELLRSAGRPIVVEIDALDAHVARVMAHLTRLNQALAYSLDAHQSLVYLEEAVNDADGWAIRDLVVPGVLAIPLKLVERAAIRRAREHQADVVRTLRSMERVLEGELIEGPPILDLRGVGVGHERSPLTLATFADGIGEGMLEWSLFRWFTRVRDALEALDELDRELYVRRERAWLAFDELSAQCAQLILNA